MKTITLILLLVCGFCLSPEAGEIYEWLDKDGVKHFTDENYIDNPGVRRHKEKRHQHKTIEAHGDDLNKTGD